MASRRRAQPIPGIGPVCTPELWAAGVDSVERIRELGWREAYLRWVERYPSRINVNAAVGIFAAEKGIPWRSVCGEEKEEIRKLVRRLAARQRL